MPPKRPQNAKSLLNRIPGVGVARVVLGGVLERVLDVGEPRVPVLLSAGALRRQLRR